MVPHRMLWETRAKLLLVSLLWTRKYVDIVSVGIANAEHVHPWSLNELANRYPTLLENAVMFLNIIDPEVEAGTGHN